MTHSNSIQLRNSTSQEPSRVRRLRHAAVYLAMISFAMTSHAMAEEVYNNFSSESVNGWWGAGPAGLPDEDVGPIRTAQQFNLNGNHTITEVSLQMARRGAPRGRVEFQIWEDDGGRPGRQVATLGSVEDIGTFPVVFAETEDATSFEEFAGVARDLATVTFDTVVSGLNPALPHYVLLDYSEASGDFPANFGWSVNEDDAGTNGVLGAMITTEFPLFPEFLGDTPHDGGDWIETRDLFPEQQYFKMSVNAVPEPSSWFLAMPALIGMLRFRRSR